MTSSTAVEARQNPLEAWRPRIGEWCLLWGVPGLEGRLTMQVSTRMVRSLGRCAPSKLEVRVAEFVVDEPRELLEEVLCHETAHAAAFELHGPRVRPHGKEWRELMERAGFPARLHIPLPDSMARSVGRKVGALWEHQCRECGATRMAGRPVRRWHCSACHRAGLSGEIEIRRMEIG